MRKLGIIAVILALFFSGVSLGEENKKAGNQKEQKDKKEQTAKKNEQEREAAKEKPGEQEIDVVITPSRYEKPTDEVSKTVNVIKKKEIETRGQKTLSDVIADSPGVIAPRTGGYGSQSTISIRGSKTEQVLVLVDGIEANDPMTPGRAAQAGLLAMPGADRVEILEGPASALYGSEAEAGVINIITKRPGLGQGAKLCFEAGSYQTWQEAANAYIGRSKYFADFTISKFDTGGISAADIRRGNYEHDGYHNFSPALKAGFKPYDWLELEAVGHAFYTQTDLDTINDDWSSPNYGVVEDDPNYTVDNTIYLSALRGNIYTRNFKQKIEFSYADYDRKLDDDPDSRHPNTSYNAEFKSYLRKLGWQGEYKPDESNNLILGFEYQEEAGSSKDRGTTDWGPYEDKFPSKSLSSRSAYTGWDFHKKNYGLFAGGRADNYDIFGYHDTGEVSGYIQPFEPGPRLRASIGTGFKAPSLYQLYAPTLMFGSTPYPVGNKDLEPEKSQSYEIGVDQELFDNKINLSATYFNMRYKDLIEYDTLKGYINIDKAKAPGWEAAINLRPLSSLDLKASYLFVDARDTKTDKKLIRRWGEKYTFGLDYHPIEKLEMNFWGVHRGATQDKIFSYPSRRVDLKSYTVVNAGVRWQIQDQLALDFRAENIFNERYYEAYGYGVLPQTFYGGISYDFKSGGGK